MLHYQIKTVFLAYGDHRFKESRKRIIEEAEATGLFTDCILETEEVQHEPEFQEAIKDAQFHRAFNEERGGGCYIWKPYIIRKNLRRLASNDILVYVDAGSTIENTQETLDEFRRCFELLKDEKGVLGRRNRHLESEYAKGDVFEYFGLRHDPEIYNTWKFQCAVHFMRKCKHSIQMYDKWWHVAKTAGDLFNHHVPSTVENYPNYIRHVWDTGTWSLICKTMGVVEVDDFPVLITRIRR